MAFFVILGADTFAVKELALVYLAIFVLMYIAGPGNYSVDRLIAKKIGGGKYRPNRGNDAEFLSLVNQ